LAPLGCVSQALKRPSSSVEGLFALRRLANDRSSIEPPHQLHCGFFVLSQSHLLFKNLIVKRCNRAFES
jgi:hypothetical protein